MERLMIPKHLYSRKLFKYELAKLPPYKSFCHDPECPITMVFDMSCIGAALKDNDLTLAIDNILPNQLTYTGISPASVIKIINRLEAD